VASLADVLAGPGSGLAPTLDPGVAATLRALAAEGRTGHRYVLRESSARYLDLGGP